MTRVSVDLPDSFYKTLSEIADELGISKAEAFRKALALLNLTIEQKKKGYDLLLANDKKKLKKQIEIL